MDNDTIRIAVGLRLGAKICEPHSCFQCGSPVDDKGTHALSCRFSKGRSSRHNTINNVIKRSLDVAGFPSHLEPPGLSQSDGKRPDGMSIVPWKHGKSLVNMGFRAICMVVKSWSLVRNPVPPGA